MTRLQSTKQLLVICLLVICVVAKSAAQEQTRSGIVKIVGADGKPVETVLYDGSYALVIGESDYTAGWNKLAGVKTDVAEVRRVLESRDFKVETELNLTSDQLKARLDRFVSDYGFGANNRLLIYFAGHGHTQKSADGRDLGYIVPVDAPLAGQDELGFKRRAIPMDTIQDYARRIEAKHALFIFDSCFSGTLISRGEVKPPPVIREDVAFPVRQFITAGAATQTVPDDSIFRRAFVRGLDGEADQNADGYITGSELAGYLKDKVTNASERTQTPQYGKIRDIALDRGDFVFTLPGTGKENDAATRDNESKTTADRSSEANPTAGGADKKRAREFAGKSLAEMMRGNFRGAGELAADALILDENLPLALAVVGWSRQNQQDPENALPFLERAVKLEPNNTLFLARLVFAYDDTGNAAAARQTADAAAKLSAAPKTAIDFYARALIENYLEKPGDALKDYTRAAELDHDFALAYNNRAGIQTINKNYDAAIADYSKFIEINPAADASAFHNRAVLFAVKGETEAAIKDFTRAIELDAKFSDAYLGRGLIYNGKGELYKAVADFTRAIELAPTDALIYQSRAAAYDRIGDKKAADADRRKYAELIKNP